MLNFANVSKTEGPYCRACFVELETIHAYCLELGARAYLNTENQ